MVNPTTGKTLIDIATCQAKDDDFAIQKAMDKPYGQSAEFMSLGACAYLRFREWRAGRDL